MLPGAHRVALAGRRGEGWYIYWYINRDRGAPCFWEVKAASRAEAEDAEQADAVEIARRYALLASPRPAPGFIASLIADFKASDEWRALAPNTQREWTRHLDRIRDVFGATSFQAIERRGSRKLIKSWHRSMSSMPRTANAALSVLVRLFNFGLDEEDLTRNPAIKIARLDEGPKRNTIVWTPQELETLLNVMPASEAGLSPEQFGRPILGPSRQNALRLAWLTGLRREDLMRLTWAEVDLPGAMIRRPTLKSRGERTAYINIGPDLKKLLLAMKPAEDAKVKSVTVVTSELGKPYKTPDAFSSSLRTAMATANIKAADGRLKHFHDLRGTRASLIFAGGSTDAEAETWFGWAPGQGAEMRDIYGDPETIAQAAGRKVRRVG